MRLTLEERLKKHTKLNEETGCWEWTRYIAKWGYGVIGIDHKAQLAHRVSYSVFKGDPTGMCVLHTCDNPKCINPDHLFLGTNADNVRDKVAKNRQSKVGEYPGEKHHGAKLTNEDVLFIRESQLSQKQLAVKFNTTQPNISLIQSRVRWAHI